MLEMLTPGEVNERCGFVLKSGEIVEIDNVAEDPTQSYKMDPAAALVYIKADTVKATWHTHPDGEPNLSGADHEGFRAWPQWEHIVLGYLQGQPAMTTYKVEDGLVITCD